VAGFSKALQTFSVFELGKPEVGTSEVGTIEVGFFKLILIGKLKLA